MDLTKKTTLDEISKKTPFTVPDNYFEDFASRMDAHVAATGRRVTPFHKLRPYLFAAAVFVGVMLVSVPMYMKKLNNLKQEKAAEYSSYVLNEVDEEALIDYVAENKSAKN